MGIHGDYCPIAVANEVMGDRWNPLVLRELMVGSQHFNDIHRGIPRISRTLLAQRLRELERRGLVERRPVPGKQAVDYLLSPAGHDLQPILWELGRWATRWMFGDPVDEQLDTPYIVWRLHQTTDPERAPKRRTTVEFATTGPGSRPAWLVFQSGASTACQSDPGYEVDLIVRADNRELHRWFIGRTTWKAASAGGAIAVLGPPRLAKAFPTWFVPGVFHADVQKAAGARVA
jgi:DNA-binding HxlR family transcriptional regulator